MFTGWNMVFVFLYLELLFGSLALAINLEKIGYDKLNIIINQIRRNL